MKIGMLIPEFPTQTHVFFWREILALRALGAEVRVLSTRRPADGCPHPFALEAARECHYLFPPSPGALLRRAGALRLAVPRALEVTGSPSRRLRVLLLGLAAAELADFASRERLDHLHVHSFADAAHVASLARAMGGPPFSLHLHGDLPVYGTDHLLKARGASFVAAAARPMQQQLIDAGIPAARTATMWMGVDCDRFVPRPRPVETTLRLITVGRLALCKGHRYALEALRQAVDQGLDATYEIVGGGPDREAIVADVERLGLGARVVMAGSLSEDRVLQRLQASDAFVLASVGLGEASPVAAMEAMACGVTPVCSIIGGTAEMIQDGETGLLVPQADVGALAADFLRLADPAERARLAARARAHAVAEFDARVLAARLLARVAASRPPPS